MSDKLLSIIMPAYNAAALIEETLESVKNQSYTHWELIVVEDFSDDGTKGIVNKFKESVDQEVVYYRNEINKGPSATRNIAASKAKGSWYAFLDSDDIWHQDHLKSLISIAQENPDNDFIHSGYNYFMEDINQPFFQQDISTEKLNNFPVSFYKQEFKVQPSSIMVSQKLFAIVNGFDESYRYAEDLNFYFRICELGYKFAYSRKNTCNYRKNPNGLTSHPIVTTFYTAKAYEATSGWLSIPENLKRNKIAGLWLSTARLSRYSDVLLAKKAIKKSMGHRITLLGLVVSLRIYLTATTKLKS
jgi:teichuronic acid biosynthesis glycosyltransferase TuaG